MLDPDTLSSRLPLQEIMVDCLVSGPGLPDLLVDAIKRDLSWERFMAGSREEGLSALIYFHQRDSFGPGLVPVFVTDVLRHDYLLNTARNKAIHSELEALSDEMGSIDLMILKGACLSRSYYPEPGLRRFNTVDLLVRKNALVEVEDALTRLGYRRDGEQDGNTETERRLCYRRDDSQAALHVQWDLLDSGNPFYPPVTMEPSGVFERAIPVRPGLLQPSPEDLIIYLSEHALRHSYSRLVLLYDLAQIFKQTEKTLDWEQLSQLADKAKLRYAVYFGACAARSLFGITLPSSHIDQLLPRKPGNLGQYVFDRILQNSRTRILQPLIGIDQQTGWLAQQLYIWKLLSSGPSAYHVTSDHASPWQNLINSASFRVEIVTSLAASWSYVLRKRRL